MMKSRIAAAAWSALAAICLSTPAAAQIPGMPSLPREIKIDSKVDTRIYKITLVAEKNGKYVLGEGVNIPMPNGGLAPQKDMKVTVPVPMAAKYRMFVKTAEWEVWTYPIPMDKLDKVVINPEREVMVATGDLYCVDWSKDAKNNTVRNRVPVTSFEVGPWTKSGSLRSFNPASLKPEVVHKDVFENSTNADVKYRIYKVIGQDVMRIRARRADGKVEEYRRALPGLDEYRSDSGFGGVGRFEGRPVLIFGICDQKWDNQYRWTPERVPLTTVE